MKKNLILIFIISVLQFFNAGCNDEQDLGDNYYYLPLYEAIDVGYPNGSIIYKSPQIYLIRDVKVPGDVISVDKDKKYIIAVKEEHEPYNQRDIKKTYKRNLQYYIIVKETDSVYGPYNKKEYFLKRKEIRVPENLVLNEE